MRELRPVHAIIRFRQVEILVARPHSTSLFGMDDGTSLSWGDGRFLGSVRGASLALGWLSLALLIRIVSSHARGQTMMARISHKASSLAPSQQIGISMPDTNGFVRI